MRRLTICHTLILLFLIPLAYSFNFGIIPKDDYKTVEQGESIQFTILSWNMGNSSYPVNIRLKTGLPGWDIIARPQDFILEPTPIAEPPYDDGEYMEIPGKGIVKANVLRVFVKVPKDAEPGTYDLTFILNAGDQGGQISIFQEREIKVTVEVEKRSTFLENSYEDMKLTAKKITEKGNDMKESVTGMISNVPFNPSIGLLIGLILMLSSIGFILIRHK